MKKITSILCLLCLTTFTFSQDLVPGKPENVGISSERLKRIDVYFDKIIAKKWMPGSVVMIARNSRMVYQKSFGGSGISGQKMKMDDVFRLASMTKPVVSTAMMILVEEGKCLLDDPVSKYLPEFKTASVLSEVNLTDSIFTSTPTTKAVTIRQLMSHTSGIGYGFISPKTVGAIYKKAGIPDGANMEATKIGEKMRILAQQPLMNEPGTKWTYGLSTDMLGYLVEVISGQNLSDFCEQRILKPLEMNDTHFFRDAKDELRLVHLFSEINDVAADVMYLPLAKNAYYPIKGAKSYYSGGSGLSGTAADYMKFIQMILNGGQLNGKSILSRKSVEAMTHNQIGDLSINERGTKFGLGFAIETEASSYHKLGSPGRLGWSGLYSTYFWIDPKEKLIAVMMTQLYPSSHQKEIYDTFEDLVYQSLVD